MTALCTGSFDPITIGHYDYISRAAALFDKVIVAVSNNTEKRYMFDAEQRVSYVRAAFADLGNVTVVTDNGWAADLAKKLGADLIVKGIRNGTDLDYEKTIASVNKAVNGVETLFIPAGDEVGFVSSTMVREMIKYGKDYAPFVPKGVRLDVKEV